jgi:hypothetical protein
VNLIAGLTAILALVVQALYAVPMAERMALGAASGRLDAIFCLSKAPDGGQSPPALPNHGSKSNCTLCVVAGFAALAAIAWLLLAQGWRAERPRPAHSAAGHSARLLRTQQSRAPPALI